MGRPHIIAIPYPAQGHVIPLLELSQCLVKHGIKVTFVNTEYNHKRVLNALGDRDFVGDQISLVSIPDGLEPWEDRNELGRLSEAMFDVMPGKLMELIEIIDGSEENEKITCVLADGSMGWAFQVAEKMGIPRAGFWPASAALLSLGFTIPKLIEDGVINEDGTPVKRQMVQLSQEMPPMDTANFSWSCIGDLPTQKSVFKVMLNISKTSNLVDWFICNSSYDLEPGAFTFSPYILPIGPLLASNRLENSLGNFWLEDSTCLKWLDQQQQKSVIYVAFGSFTVFDQTQFQELALGLELSNKPYLWVVRPDFTSETNDAFLEGFKGRIGTKGKLVGWAPQQKVLGHPSIACFLSHCGWNSTIEGVGNGVPFLCWPYFCDQFINESYICDIWKVGLRLQKNDNGVITSKEIKDKVEQLLNDPDRNEKASHLKELVVDSVSEGGLSEKTMKNLIEWIKN